MAEGRGIDVRRENDGSLLFASYLLDAGGAKIVAGATNLRIWHVVPTTGALTTADFAASPITFSAGIIVTSTLAMTLTTAENGGYATGLWTARIAVADIMNFSIGDKYIFEVTNASLPSPQQRMFQYGGVEGDSLEPTNVGRTLDVSLTGAAGLDFNNVEQNLGPGTTELTNILIPAMVTRWKTNDAAGTPAALSTNGYLQAMLLRWLTDNAGGTPDVLTFGYVRADVKMMNGNAGQAGNLDQAISTIPAATAALVPGGVAAVSGTINDAAATTTSFIVNIVASSAVNNFYSGLLSFTTGALIGTGGRTIASYNGTTKRITLYKPLPSAPVNGVGFNITADDKTGGQTSTGY